MTNYYKACLEYKAAEDAFNDLPANPCPDELREAVARLDMAEKALQEKLNEVMAA